MPENVTNNARKAVKKAPVRWVKVSVKTRELSIGPINPYAEVDWVFHTAFKVGHDLKGSAGGSFDHGETKLAYLDIIDQPEAESLPFPHADLPRLKNLLLPMRM